MKPRANKWLGENVKNAASDQKQGNRVTADNVFSYRR